MTRHLDIRIRGIVQGVGFRPFVFGAARKTGIAGTVMNDGSGVFIEAEGEGAALDAFGALLRSAAPPLARIISIEAAEGPARGIDGFRITPSGPPGERTAFYAPDVALCDDCLRELRDPGDRRYRYPYITCINCGPRFSIVTDIPYDRPNTAMAPFIQCPACAAEYADPGDRRFHSQPNCCPACGPGLTLRDRAGVPLDLAGADLAARVMELLAGGAIVAVKGVGGYHLAVDACNDGAVAELRRRKKRPWKPFALMAGAMQSIESFCRVGEVERELLCAPERPIVLLEETAPRASRLTAPGLSWMGVMLPGTPIQHLLFDARQDALLVMTSGNVTDEPIEFRDGQALSRLAPVADYFITGDREILAQSDDSVMQVVAGRPFFIRRARGFVPVPFITRHAGAGRPLLAMGGDLKSSFALARRDFVIASQYLGDMEDPLTWRAFRETVGHFIRIFDAEPETIVSDLHPGYLTTQFADELAGDAKKRLRVQHHHAHAAAVMEEHGLDGAVIGISFDGTGYGSDGTLWGSEFLAAHRAGFTRAAHFADFPLPGGEGAIRDIWKIGLALLHGAFGDGVHRMPMTPERAAVLDMIERGLPMPRTCSIGRLFDGVAAILGVRESVSAEAEAAQLLEEAAARGSDDDVPFLVPLDEGETIVVCTPGLVRHLVALRDAGRTLDDIALVFHRALVATAVRVAALIRERTGLDRVTLSGGVFHNRLLLAGLMEGLAGAGFTVYVHEKLPCNDGCIAVGQAAIARALGY